MGNIKLERDKVCSILDKISIFGGLTIKQLDCIFDSLQERTYKKNEIIFKEKESPNCIYIVLEGSVNLFKGKSTNQFILHNFKEGELFGETSLIGIQSHTASAKANTDTRIILFPKTALFSLYKEHLDIFSIIILNIAREACRRLSTADNLLEAYVNNEK